MSNVWNNRIKQYLEENQKDPRQIVAILSCHINEAIDEIERREGIKLNGVAYIKRGNQFHAEISMSQGE